MMTKLGVALVLSALGVAAVCAPEPDKPAASRPFEADILKVAKEFKVTGKGYDRVSNRANWSPELCRTPTSGVQHSSSTDEATHGRKLYFLYAKDPGAYDALSFVGRQAEEKPWANPVGQAVVKESFAPVETKPREYPPPEYAEIDGKTYRTGEPIGLFIMLKLDPKTPGTDEGWVYATTTPDGKQVTSIGRVGACMNCHEETVRDRLYGAPWSWPYDAEAKMNVTPTKQHFERARKQYEAQIKRTDKPDGK